MLNHIYKLIVELIGLEVLYFDTPIKIQMGGLLPAIHLWAACATSEGDVMVMDVERKWHPIDPAKDAQVMEVLLHRVRYLVQLKNTKVEEVKL